MLLISITHQKMKYNMFERSLIVLVIFLCILFVPFLLYKIMDRIFHIEYLVDSKIEKWLLGLVVGVIMVLSSILIYALLLKTYLYIINGS